MGTAEFATADLLDEFEDQLQVCELPLRQYGGRRVFSGRVRTVRCREDNVRMRELIETAGDGAVVVVDGGGSLHTALLGDRLAEVARGNGWSGFVIIGAVRDTGVLATLDIGVKALGANPRRSRKVGAGTVDEPVSVGGVVVAAGDYLWSDDDGVVIARADTADAVLGRLAG